MKSYFRLCLSVLLLCCSVNPLSADFRETLYFKTDKAGKVPFSHEVHLPAKSNNCSACHNSLFHIVRSRNQAVTMAEMENVLARLRERGVKTFTMVGGAVVTQEYADRIGADLYARDAMEAVARIRQLLGR